MKRTPSGNLQATFSDPRKLWSFTENRLPTQAAHDDAKESMRHEGSMPTSTSQQQQKPNVDSLILSTVMAPPPLLTPGAGGPFQFPLTPGVMPGAGAQALVPFAKPSASKKKGKKGQASKQPAQRIDPTTQSQPQVQRVTSSYQPPPPAAARPKTRAQVDAIKKMIFGNSLGMGLPLPGSRPRNVRRAYVS